MIEAVELKTLVPRVRQRQLLGFKIFIATISGMVIFGGMWAILAVPSWLIWWRKGDDLPGPIAFGAYAVAFTLWITLVVIADPLMFAP